jgi:hypothetical protein
MRAAAVGLLAGWIAVASAADAPRFFPGIDAFHGDWYGKQLQALQELPLCCDATDRGRVVRFIWLRSFHHPVVIRLNESMNGSWRAVTKIGTGAGGYEPGTILSQAQRTLTADQAATVVSLFNPTSWFWSTMSSTRTASVANCPRDPGNECVTIGVDGAQWIVEVRDGDRYHYVDRWSPESGPVRKLGEQLMALSQQDFGKVY